MKTSSLQSELSYSDCNAIYVPQEAKAKLLECLGIIQIRHPASVAKKSLFTVNRMPTRWTLPRASASRHPTSPTNSCYGSSSPAEEMEHARTTSIRGPSPSSMKSLNRTNQLHNSLNSGASIGEWMIFHNGPLRSNHDGLRITSYRCLDCYIA